MAYRYGRVWECPAQHVSGINYCVWLSFVAEVALNRSGRLPLLVALGSQLQLWLSLTASASCESNVQTSSGTVVLFNVVQRAYYMRQGAAALCDGVGLRGMPVALAIPSSAIKCESAVHAVQHVRFDMG